MWPCLTYNKFAVEEPMEAPIEKFRPLDFKESSGLWEAQTVTGNPLGNVSHQVGEKIQKGLLEQPATVEIPAGAIVRRGDGLIVARTFQVLRPVQALVIEVKAAYCVATDPTKAGYRILVANHLLEPNTGR